MEGGKKTYTILASTQLVEYVTYTVEAESEREALDLVEDGEVESNCDHWTKEVGGGTQYEVTNVE